MNPEHQAGNPCELDGSGKSILERIGPHNECLPHIFGRTGHRSDSHLQDYRVSFVHFTIGEDPPCTLECLHLSILDAMEAISHAE